MMTDAAAHPLVRDYLARLEAEARRLPPEQAQELVADIHEHLGAALEGQPSEADVRNLLDRLGTPAEVVEAAGPAPLTAPAAMPPGAPSRVGGLEVSAVVLLLLAEVLSVLVPIAAVLWIIGLVLLLASRAWTGSERLRGFLALGTGLPVALLFLGVSLGITSVESCVSEGSTAGGPADQVCTSSGPPAWVGMAVLVGLVGYLVWQIRTAYVLLARRRQA